MLASSDIHQIAEYLGLPFQAELDAKAGEVDEEQEKENQWYAQFDERQEDLCGYDQYYDDGEADYQYWLDKEQEQAEFDAWYSAQDEWW